MIKEVDQMLKFSAESLRTLDFQYLQNSYFIADVKDDVITVKNSMISNCRDHFLMEVDKSLRLGKAETLTIALVGSSMHSFTDVKTYSLAGYPTFSTIGGRQTKVKYKTIEYDILLFDIDLKTYYNPAVFWVLTEVIRRLTLSFTKINYNSDAYHSPDYNHLYKSLCRHAHTPLIVNPTFIYDHFMPFNSPLGIIHLQDKLKDYILRHLMTKPKITASTIPEYTKFFSPFLKYYENSGLTLQLDYSHIKIIDMYRYYEQLLKESV